MGELRELRTTSREEYAVALSARCVGLASALGHELGDAFDAEVVKHSRRKPSELLIEIRRLASFAIQDGVFE